MADVLLFHHAQGLTEGVVGFANALRSSGHTVHLPDLFEGSAFDTVDDGVGHAEALGLDMIIDRAVSVAADLPPALVYAGFSLGALPAQLLAQTRPGCLGALLYHGGVRVDSFDAPWPVGVDLQLHLAENDPWSELDVAQELSNDIDGAELFVYPGSAHLFADSSLADYEARSAALLLERTLAFLARSA